MLFKGYTKTAGKTTISHKEGYTVICELKTQLSYFLKKQLLSSFTNLCNLKMITLHILSVYKCSQEICGCKDI